MRVKARAVLDRLSQTWCVCTCFKTGGIGQCCMHLYPTHRAASCARPDMGGLMNSPCSFASVDSSVCVLVSCCDVLTGQAAADPGFPPGPSLDGAHTGRWDRGGQRQGEGVGVTVLRACVSVSLKGVMSAPQGWVFRPKCIGRQGETFLV